MGSGRSYWYRYGGTGWLRILAFSVYGRGDAKTSNVQVDSVSLQAEEYLGFEVLEGEEGNSFYGSRFGGTTVL